MNPVPRNIVKSVAFILILVLILACLSCLYAPRSIHASYDLNYYHYSGIYGEPDNTLDALIMGDSLSYMCLSPMEMWKQEGFTAFACGCAMQPIRRVYENLHYIFRTQSPKLVVLETNCLYTPKTSYEDLFRTELDLALPVLSFHDMWRKAPKSSLLGKKVPEFIDDGKGCYPLIGTKAWDFQEYMIPSEGREPIGSASLTCMDRIVRLCQKNGAQVLLLSVPSPTNWTYEKHNAVQDYAEGRGIPYWDLNLVQEEIGLDWSQHTWDSGDHLNAEGNAICSRYLARQLRQAYDLPDHREDSAYGEWDTSLQNYEAWLQSDAEHRVPPLREKAQHPDP